MSHPEDDSSETEVLETEDELSEFKGEPEFHHGITNCC